MNRKSLRRVPFFSHYCCSAAMLPLLFLGFALSFGAVAQSPSGDPDNRHLAKLGAVKFVIPRGFRMERSVSPKMSFLRNSSEPLGLFVAIPEHQLDDKYLTDLAADLSSILRRGQAGFTWRRVEISEPRLSRYETNRGIIKGLGGNTFLQVDYVVVKAQGKEVVVGSIAEFGEERAAKFLFDAEGREYSVQGWEALFQLISSVTGEIN